MFGAGLVVAALCAARFANAALYSDVKQLPTTTFDFVIIGAGSAGNVVATRLTEDPKCSVLVIEAGINNAGVDTVAAPGLAGLNLPNSSVTWNYSTTPQAALNGRVLPYSRGRVLGGSSSLNFMVYTRGSNAEYDRWANLTGDEGWAWKNVSQFYFKNSRMVPPADGHNVTGQFIPADHGNGPVEISLPSFPSVLDDRIVNTAKASEEFPLNPDFQSGDSTGVALIQATVGGGQRSSSAVAYLQPALKRPNLHVLIENTVTRLVQTGHVNGKPSFKKVEFAPSAHAKRSTVTAKNEVILSAGTLNTPQILQLSGIGNKTELAKLGIKSTVDLPDVGEHMQDHPILSNYWTVSATNTTDDLIRNPALFTTTLQQWTVNHTGPFTDPPATGVGFIRLPANASIFKNVSDPSAGPGSGHYELVWTNGFAPDVASVPATGHYVTIHTAIVTPTSLGTVKLASSDPFTFPLSNPNFLSTEFDRFAMLEAVKGARRFAAAAPWQDFIVDRFGVMGAAETDEELAAAILESTVTIWHPTSSARMSPRGAKFGVVDPDLLVKGVSGLRIVDASVFPAIPACHTVAPVYIVAERASQLIKDTWYLK